MIRTRLRKRRSMSSMPEINLTPLIDTALTLLVIFMLTTPIVHNAIKVRLPKGQAQEAANEATQLVVAVDAKGGLFFNNKPISLDKLGTAIKQTLRAKPGEHSVWVHIDACNSCDTLIGVIDRIKVVGGVKDVNVATQNSAVAA